MRSLKLLSVAVAYGVMPLAAAQQPMVLPEVVDKIMTQEHREMQLLRQYSPLVRHISSMSARTSSSERCPTATNTFWAGRCSPKEWSSNR